MAVRTQDRNAVFLLLNTGLGAALGLLFWMLAARLVGPDPAVVGVAYVIIAVGTLAAVVGKGGLDTALLVHIPGAGRIHRRALMRLAVGVGTLTAVAIVGAFALAASGSGSQGGLGAVSWFLAAAIAALLVITWLQDAWFLADGRTRFGFQRNVVANIARIVMLLVFVAIALPFAIALAWAAALVAAAMAGLAFGRRTPATQGEGEPVPTQRFLRTAFQNLSGSTAEFVPGLLLAPLVFGLAGAADAAYFAMAWAGASLLFLACAAIARATLASMAGRPQAHLAPAVRRGVLQLACVVLPAVGVGLVLAPWALSILGTAYVEGSTAALRILVLSSLFVAPTYLYLSVLRAQARVLPLWLVPVALCIALLIMTPPLILGLGLAGVGLAWTLAHVPLACYSAWKLREEGWGVNALGPAAPFRGHPHAE